MLGIHSRVAGPSWWDWRLSARFRAVSLLSAWMLVSWAAILGPLLVVLVGARFALSAMQMVLNASLGRRQPLGKRDRWDWALFAAMMAGAIVASALGAQSLAGPMLPLLPVLVPFSLIQVRMYRRSKAAGGQPGPSAAAA